MARWHRTGSYTRSDGTKVRGYTARNPRRGSDSRRSKAAYTVAIALSATITVGGVTAGLAISSSGGSAASAASNAKGEKLDVTASGESAWASFKNTAEKILASGYKNTAYLSSDQNCASHSEGKIQEFFRSNPCKWLARAYIVVQQDSQGMMLVNITWVDMPDSTLAEECKQLMDTPGSGSITELSRESGPYRDTPLSKDYYMTGISGAVVWNVQIQPFNSIPADIISTIVDDSYQ